MSPRATVAAPRSSSTSAATVASSSASGTARWIIPHAAGVGAVDRAAEQQQLLGPGHADQAGQQPGGAAVGGEAPRREGLPERGCLGGDGEVGRPARSGSRARRPSPAPRTPPAAGPPCSSAISRWAWRAVRRWRLPGAGLRRPPALLATQSAPEQKSSPALREQRRPGACRRWRPPRAPRPAPRTATGSSAPLRAGRSMVSVQHAVGGLDADPLGGRSRVAHRRRGDERRPEVERRGRRRCRSRAPGIHARLSRWFGSMSQVKPIPPSTWTAVDAFSMAASAGEQLGAGGGPDGVVAGRVVEHRGGRVGRALGQRGAHVHVGQQVLDGLERADGGAELLALERVGPGDLEGREATPARVAAVSTVPRRRSRAASSAPPTTSPRAMPPTRPTVASGSSGVERLGRREGRRPGGR